jgi:hypothetical protein
MLRQEENPNIKADAVALQAMITCHTGNLQVARITSL